jgi:predicted metal-dependent phosphoesterase TrpH
MMAEMTFPGDFFSYRGSIHNHSIFSDGTGSVDEILAAAHRAGLDYLILTDHNQLVEQSLQGWWDGVLFLIDIEVNDMALEPERNHLLTLNVNEDMTPYAPDPQKLIDAVRERGGLTFLAHPIDLPGPLIKDIYPWTDWDIEGYTGVELWNFMSEFRVHATSKPVAILMAYFPQLFTTGPFPEMLAKWDELLQQHPTAAIGGPDAHAQTYRIGPLKRRFLPYDYCFRAVNTHIITRTAFNHDFKHDKALIYEALAAARAWIGYDLLHPTEGFSYFGETGNQHLVQMGESVALVQGLTLKVMTPAKAHIKLIRAGSGVVAEAKGSTLTYEPDAPGAYRVEVWKTWWFKPRGWIFSNPIYVT